LETQFSGDNIVLVFPDGSSPALLSAMIAGVPYNKAHVLEFAPGEIRLDVTMAPTLKLYEAKLKENAGKYNALIAEGKVELERLRSMKVEDIVSKKDMLIEKERIELEEEYQARIADEESVRQERLAMQQEELERTHLRSRGIQVDERTSTDTTGEAPIPSLVIGGAIAAYAVVALSSAGQNTDNDPRRSNTTTISPIAPDGNVLTDASRVPILGNGPTAVAEAGLFADMVDDYQMPTSTSHRDAPLYDPKRSNEERKDNARQAMQDYMDQDDGGDAWLQSMATIIDEGGEDDLFVSDTEETTGLDNINGEKL
jgi:hypothetical protein